MRKSILLASVALGLLATPATAQTAPTDSAPTQTDTDKSAQPAPSGLADIVVTATKRASNVQDLPVAVTAITAEALQSKRISEFGDLTRAAASLTLTENPVSPNDAIVLRGIGTYAFSIGVESSVAVIIDDVPVVQQAQAFDNLADIERIEVLRGPQSTLFGKTASAGAINLVTRDTSDTLQVSADVTAATDADYKGDFSIAGPLTDGITARLSGYYNNYAGNVRNLTDNALLNGEEAWGIHGKIKIEATPRLTIVLNGSYQRQHTNGQGTPFSYVQLNYVPTGGTTPVAPTYNGVSLLPDLAGLTLNRNNYVLREDNDGYTDNRQTTVSMKATYDLDFANLVSVTSYQDWHYNFSTDVDSTDLNINAAVAIPPFLTTPQGGGNGIDQSGPYHSTEFTQELRLVSKSSGPFNYVVGAFYANAPSTRSFTRGPVLQQANWSGYQGTRNVAGFLGAEYKLPTKTKISGELRLNNERIQDYFIDYLPSHNTTQAVIDANCGVGAPNCSGRHTDTAVTWKVAVDQQLASRVSAYASVATGYKGAAYDISSGYNPDRTANPVQPEHSTAYEIGLKSRMFDNRVQLNVAAFYTDYNNFQAQSSQYVGNILVQKLNNVGKLRTEGIEVEALARPTNWLHFDGSAAYTVAKIVSFPNAACYAGQLQTGTGCTLSPDGLGYVQDRSGGALPDSPRFKFNLGATIDQQLNEQTKASFNLTYQHQSSVNFDLLGDPYDVQKAYGLLNASIGINRGAYRVSVFVNNLLDTHYAVGLTDGFGTWGVHVISQVVPRDSQRYAGITLGASF